MSLIQPRFHDVAMAQPPIAPMAAPATTETTSVRNANHAQRPGWASLLAEASATAASRAASANPS